ncbi:hypothetical protein F0562_033109 [Nyssa sinensis]|uniref:Uncharacterized protein n=1 Tax=Nyssa sinensis TaxID=561372 RepID=A0A5J5ASS6_9ASTE|nr:hypothetical protein F0562_033109 [Nyssa sinensis]
MDRRGKGEERGKKQVEEREKGNVDEDDGYKKRSLEQVFMDIEVVPSWRKQITVRAMVTSFVLSVVFNFIVCKLNLTTGIIPSLNVAAGLLGFAMIKSWTALLHKLGGTASYLLGMSTRVAAQADAGNTPVNVKNLSLGWMIGFLFVVSFVGLFSIVPLRKLMILKYKLAYPSGTATAYLINSFHTPKGAKLAKFYFDFSSTYVGVGMICPYMINISLLIGAVFSWGIMWPLIEHKKGYWYSAEVSENSLHGIQGYRVFLAIAMMLGDGLFQFVYMIIMTSFDYIAHRSEEIKYIEQSSNAKIKSFDEQRRTEYFLKDQISNSFAIIGYLILAGISIIALPLIFHPLRWDHVMVAYLIAPILAFCNSYGSGLTDWSLANNYGKLAILIFSGWVGLERGGVLAGLAACGVMMSIVSTSSDLMQDFKTGYLTLASPRSMFFSQVYGTAIGCFTSPLIFWFFYKAYAVGDPTGSYPAPYGLMYRGIALLGVEGFSALPKNCVKLAIAFFMAALVINIAREILRHCETQYRIYGFIPSPMCMAIPFYLGPYFVIDMCIGSLILFIWEKKNKQKAKEFAPAIASGLICGESLWGVPAAVLSLAGVEAPICMKFLSSSTNKKVDTFLGS